MKFASSLIPHPSSLIPNPSSLIPHPSSLIPHPSSLIPHPSSLIPHPSSLIPHPSSLIPRPSASSSVSSSLCGEFFLLLCSYPGWADWPKTEEESAHSSRQGGRKCPPPAS